MKIYQNTDLLYFNLKAKRNPSSPDPTIDVVKNPHYLVLISEAFMEARAALSRSGITTLPAQSPIKVDTTSIPPVSGPPPTSVTSNASLMNRQPIPAGTIPPATVKVVSTVNLIFCSKFKDGLIII